MATVTFNGNSYTCATAIKNTSAGYVHLYDASNNSVAFFDGVTDFSGFAIADGSWSECSDPNCGDETLIHTYTHSKSGTVHNFVGSGANGKALITAAFTSGDTISVNGVAKPAYCGADAVDGDTIVNGRWVSFTYDGTQVNFKGGGGLSNTKLAAATATASDVAAGKTFYAGNNTVKTGEVEVVNEDASKTLITSTYEADYRYLSIKPYPVEDVLFRQNSTIIAKIRKSNFLKNGTFSSDPISIEYYSGQRSQISGFVDSSGDALDTRRVVMMRLPCYTNSSVSATLYCFNTSYGSNDPTLKAYFSTGNTISLRCTGNTTFDPQVPIGAMIESSSTQFTGREDVSGYGDYWYI